MAAAKKAFISGAIRREYEKGMKGCPPATQDVHVNLENRNHAIKDYGYGPLNPNEQNRKFWKEKAEMWGVTPEEAKKSRCGNCAAFIQTSQMMACIAKGMDSGEDEYPGHSEEVIEASNLGYCEFFHFKCAGDRTCDAWIVGGPVK
jgi:hypothetical protein